MKKKIVLAFFISACSTPQPTKTEVNRTILNACKRVEECTDEPADKCYRVFQIRGGPVGRTPNWEACRDALENAPCTPEGDQQITEACK